LLSGRGARTEEDRAISAIEYEAFSAWPNISSTVVRSNGKALADRVGPAWCIESEWSEVNEPSLWVEVVGPHRGERLRPASG